jgi:flagellar biosynthetic protein FliR
MQGILQMLPSFLLVFCRITAFFVTVPVISSRNIPAQFKIGLAFFVTLITFFTMNTPNDVVWDSFYVLAIIREALAGLLLGFVAYLFFTVVQIAGTFIDMQMGLGLANVMDPLTGVQSPLLGNFKFFIAMLLFLSMNGHHLLVRGIIESYHWLPVNNDLFLDIYAGDVSEFLLVSFSKVFTLAFQLAAPLVAAMFLVDVAFGILARTAPQFQIFVIGIPIKLLLGFALLLLLIPGFLYLFQELFKTMFKEMERLLFILQQ